MKIVLCGRTFPDAPVFLKNALRKDVEHDILVWSGDEIGTLPKGIDVLIPKMQRIDSRIMDEGSVRLIQQWGVGLEGVDLAAAKARGIPVANVSASGGNADSVAEHAILLVLALLRKLNLAEANVRSGVLGSPLGETLAGRTVCLYGLGAVALSIAKRLRAFDVRLTGLTRDPEAPKIAQYALDRCFSVKERDQCLRETDILILCVRHSQTTRDLIGVQELSSLPAGAYLINIARGGLVNHQALCASLREGHLGGVGLDVYWHEPIKIDDEIFSFPNVVATPHIAGITTESLLDIADGVSQNIERLRQGLPLINQVM